MDANEKVVSCFSMSLEELNRNVERWLSDLQTNKTTLLDGREYTVPGKDTIMRNIVIRTYRDGYVYLIELSKRLVPGEADTYKGYQVVGFCRPDSYLTRVELNLASVAKLLRHIDKCPYSDKYISEELSKSMQALERVQYRYAKEHCWETL